jgi:hypothetical protein
MTHLIVRPLVVTLVGTLVLSFAAVSARGATPPDKVCRAAKNKIVGKYAACRQNAEAKFATSAGDQAASALRSAAFTKCKDSFTKAWDKADAKAAAKHVTCLESPLTDEAFGAVIDIDTTNVSDGLAGQGLSDVSQELTECTSTQATCQSDLASCQTSSSTCTSTLTTCQTTASTCASNLTTCQASLASCQSCGNGVKDAGEQCDGTDLGGATCATVGAQVGTLRCGSGCTFDASQCFDDRFVDTGAGTIIDRQTGLEWEKKDGVLGTPGGSIHDVNDAEDWHDNTGAAPSGGLFVAILGLLNGAYSGACFKDRCDWRVPEVDELLSIRQCPAGGGTCIDPIFGPTGDIYWTIDSGGLNNQSAQTVNFEPSEGGALGLAAKSGQALWRVVRTVRPQFSEP